MLRKLFSLLVLLFIFVLNPIDASVINSTSLLSYYKSAKDLKDSHSHIFDIDAFLFWDQPAEFEYILAGNPNLIILVNSSSDTPANLNIFLSNETLDLPLGSAISNVSTTVSIPNNYIRGPANLLANTTLPYSNPSTTLSIFVNTTVTISSPINNTFYGQNGSIPVQLYAADGQNVTGTVLMACSDGSNDYQSVNNTEVTNFFSENSGECSFSIESLIDEYTNIAENSNITIFVSNKTILVAPQNMTVEVPSIVYVNTTSSIQTGSFVLSLFCSGTFQTYPGVYNTPIEIIPSNPMGPDDNCLLFVPGSDFYTIASETVSIFGVISIESVSPDPVSAGANLTINIDSTAINPVPVYASLNCSDTINTIEGFTPILELPVSSLVYGNCSLIVRAIDPDALFVYDEYPFNVTVSPILIIAPEMMVIDIPSIVYVNTTLSLTPDTFNMTFTCGEIQQIYNGTFNVPVAVTPNHLMGPYAGCNFSVQYDNTPPASATTDVYGTVTFEDVYPNPVNATTDLFYNFYTSDHLDLNFAVSLACEIGATVVVGNTFSSNFFNVPSILIGNCSLTATSLPDSDLLYTQIVPQNVTVDNFLYWIVPSTDAELVAGELLDIFVVPPVVPRALNYNVSLGGTTFLGSAVTYIFDNVTIPLNYPRGAAYLYSITDYEFYNPTSNVSIFVVTTVSLASPIDGQSYPQLSSVPVRLLAADGQSVVGTVQMSCSGDYTISQTVYSTRSTSFISPNYGICTFTIIEVFDQYTQISNTVAVEVTIFPSVSPTGGPLYPLTEEQINSFAQQFTAFRFPYFDDKKRRAFFFK